MFTPGIIYRHPSIIAASWRRRAKLNRSAQSGLLKQGLSSTTADVAQCALAPGPVSQTASGN